MHDDGIAVFTNYPGGDECLDDNCRSSHLTFFFRDVCQLNHLMTSCVPYVEPSTSHLHVWCTACSSGEEAYTFGVLLSEYYNLHRTRDWTIVGTDSCRAMINIARQAIYPAKSMDFLPLPLRHTYFSSCGTAHFRVNASLTDRIDFECRDLFEERNFDRLFHVIVCRNLLIYLDWYQQQTLIRHLARFLVPDGFLVLGDLEGLAGLDVPFCSVGNRIYKRVGFPPKELALESQGTERNTTRPTGRSGMKFKLLVVDRCPSLLILMGSFLASLGHHVELASPPSEAFGLMQTHDDYDLLVLDLSLPHQTCEEILATFKDSFGDNPVILLTRMGYEEAFLNRLLTNRTATALSKTLPLEHFGHRIQSILEHSVTSVN